MRTLSGMAKARQKVTREFYDSLVDAYRETPAAHHAVASTLGISVAMARRAWFHAWEKHPYSPVKQVIDEEREHARRRHASMLDQAEDSDRERAREDSIDSRANELLILKHARSNVLDAYKATLDLGGMLSVLCSSMRAKIEEGLADMTIAQQLGILSRYMTVQRKLAGTAAEIIRLSREARGEAGTIVGHQFEDMTVEDAILEIAGAQDVLTAVRERGLLPEAAVNVIEAELVKN